MKKFVFCCVLAMCSSSFSQTEYYCEADQTNDFFNHLNAGFVGSEAFLMLIKENDKGLPEKFTLSADRSVEDATIFYTSDESVLVIETNEVLENPNKVRGVYMIPPRRVDIPVTCESVP